jgi:hypothetical protein
VVTSTTNCTIRNNELNMADNAVRDEKEEKRYCSSDGCNNKLTVWRFDDAVGEMVCQVCGISASSEVGYGIAGRMWGQYYA